jgi:hypothetical protein
LELKSSLQLPICEWKAPGLFGDAGGFRFANIASIAETDKNVGISFQRVEFFSRDAARTLVDG